ncbi:MAG: 50S ribosomal protein L21 [Clostridiales bacterium]|nr:50S ribosomal protein L21 [Clostridiales bacterium]
MYAIIQTGGKQYKVEVGDQILVEKLSAVENTEVEFETLLVADDSGGKVGKPVLSGVMVRGKVLEHGKGKKVVVFKYKPKKDSRTKRGHRQPYTKVEILAIG